MDTKRDRATVTVKSGSTVFSVPPAAACMHSMQLKSSAFKCTQACRKAPAKVITMNVSGGNIKGIFELLTNKLEFSPFCKDEDTDPDSPSPH